MMVFFIIVIICTALYSNIIISFIKGFNILKSVTETYGEKTAFSVIIPFRNEALYLPELLASIQQLNYSKTAFEILLVDDQSSDNSVAIIEAFINDNPTINIIILENNRVSNSPKKDAISTAIHQAKHDWIITTDADCILPVNWLKSFNNTIEKHQPNMIAGPVSLNSNNSFLEQFQLIDFLSMQGSTIGGFGIKKPFMTNGANLGYRKALFFEVNGFESNNTIASGDDVFLLEQFLNLDSSKVCFLKSNDALVNTFPVNNWNTLIQQRKRWAAKATYYNNRFTQIIGLAVFFTNLFIIASFILSPFQLYYLIPIGLKYSIDSILIYKTAAFYQQKINTLQFIKTLFFYPFFTVFIAITSLLGSYQWKDRNFKA